jgi:hypothetical protein
MKILLFVLLLVAAGCAHAEKRTELQKQRIAESTGGAITNGFDPSFIELLPSQRAAALKRAQPSGGDSSPDWYNKSAAYYSALTNMIQGIRSHYYCQNVLPSDLFAGLEQHAVVLASIQYPLAATGGCSGYSALLVEKKIKLAEDMICRMVSAIYSTEYWDYHAAKPSNMLLSFIVLGFKSGMEREIPK